MIDTKDKKTAEKKQAQKFLFDQNCFDDGYVEDIIEEEPPPPTFSEAELASAEQNAFNKGKQEGLAEAEASREKHVAGILEQINQSMQTLFAAEQQRNDQYEGEAVALAYAIFKKLFPALDERHGLTEIEAVLMSVLDAQKGQQEIAIEIHPDYSDSIETRLEMLRDHTPSGCQIVVIPRDALGPGDCRMYWNNGGAGRNATALAEEIHRQLEHMLADTPTLQDNEVSEAAAADEDITENTDE
ncbi:MAG: flagellar protein FlbE [Rhodospirillales bacterium]|nr:flagellar protein FlbE [Rhodospirillales bacterium]